MNDPAGAPNPHPKLFADRREGVQVERPAELTDRARPPDEWIPEVVEVHVGRLHLERTSRDFGQAGLPEQITDLASWPNRMTLFSLAAEGSAATDASQNRLSSRTPPSSSQTHAAIVPPGRTTRRTSATDA